MITWTIRASLAKAITYIIIVVLFCTNNSTAQNTSLPDKLVEARRLYQYSTLPQQKLNGAMTIINRYAGEGGAFDDTAQSLIYVAKNLNRAYKNDTVNYYLQIWQTEIFYYAGLYQFGIGSAEKQIQYANSINDSFLIGSAHFFKAINLLELDSFELAKHSLKKALAIYPTHKPQHAYRKLAYHNQLVNVYAEAFYEQQNYDSALHYNAQAIQEAYSENSIRGIPASHLVQGKIFFALGNFDSARHHFEKTIILGTKNNHDDLVLAAIGKLMHLHNNNVAESNRYLNNGLYIINNKVINNSFKSFFYADAIAVCKKQGNLKQLQALQSMLLTIKAIDIKTGNTLVQNITTQMLANENNLLKLEVKDAEKKKQLRTLQLLIALLLSILMISIFLYIIKRKKTQYALLQQKSMIARELHDDLGASISSISMYAQVVSQRMLPNTNAQLPLTNIQNTVQEISNNLKDIIWFINPKNETFEKLLDRIRQYAEPVCMEQDIQFTLQYDKHQKFASLAVGDKKNIYLIVKEAINNALKYAQAKHINIRFQYHQKSRQIIIKDDGIGLPANITEGNGIRNMYARAYDLKGDISFESKNGTTITLTI